MSKSKKSSKVEATTEPTTTSSPAPATKQKLANLTLHVGKDRRPLLVQLDKLAAEYDTFRNELVWRIIEQWMVKPVKPANLTAKSAKVDARIAALEAKLAAVKAKASK